jgi:exonuclease III
MKKSKQKRLILGAWNVRTLQDRENIPRPERRTALISKELARYRIDIAALSETRLADEGMLKEIKGGYTFFWRGRPESEDRLHGVGLAIRSSLMKDIPTLPVGINERLMKIRFPLSKTRHMTIISAYAPTLTSPDDAKEQFYEDLNQLIRDTHTSDKLLILGDFNARVGRDSDDWKGVLGPHGVGKANSNGLLLLSMCAEHRLCITNTTFRQADKYKTTWMHPRSKQWHLIDYIIVRQRDTKDVRITRVMRGAECWTDHRLVRAVLQLHIAPTQRRRPKIVRAAFNTARLKHDLYQQRFQEALDENLKAAAPLAEDSTEKWCQFKKIVTDTATATLGPKKRVHQDWFDENDERITQLLSEKNKAYMEWQNDPTSVSKADKFKHLRSKAQKEIREMKDKWWDQKADEVQRFADSHNSKQFFNSLKAVYGPSRSGSTPLRSADGSTLIKEQEALRERWAEHFSTLLNQPSSVDPAALGQVPQLPTLHKLDLPPNAAEVKKAISQMNSDRASGMDGIPAEVYKAAGTEAHDVFLDIIRSIWEQEKMPEDFRDALIVALYKNKGSKADCGNYRGISLLSIAGKIFARIILNRLITVAEANLPEAQCGFRPGRSTVDMIFTVRQVQEKCLEQNLDLYSVFIDLTKAFDTVNREALWTMLAKYGCPRKFVQIIRLFHDGMSGQVLSNGDQSGHFGITNGVKQGCVLAPVLFNLFFTCVLRHAVQDLQEGVYVRYRYDGSIFDLRRLNAKTKTLTELLQEALFADDCALMAHRPDALQVMLNKFSESSKLFGLTISLAKTEVLFQPAPENNTSPPPFSIDGTVLKFVDSFKYLGSIISNDGQLDREIQSRISKASQALGRLRNRVLNHHNVSLSTKLKVYNAVVLTSLLYGCESWTVYRRHISQLEKFHMRALRSILQIRWQDKVTNLEVLDRADSTSIESMLLKAQLRWTGHVIRMSDERIPKQLFFGELAEGHRKQGRPRKRYKDNLKDNLKWCEVKPKELQQVAQDRTQWRAATRHASISLEEDRRMRQISARERRHRAAAAPVTETEFRCPTCNRLCRSRLGLQSHSRVHGKEHRPRRS